jgi:hypothetical protein
MQISAKYQFTVLSIVTVCNAAISMTVLNLYAMRKFHFVCSFLCSELNSWATTLWQTLVNIKFVQTHVCEYLCTFGFISLWRIWLWKHAVEYKYIPHCTGNWIQIWKQKIYSIRAFIIYVPTRKWLLTAEWSFYIRKYALFIDKTCSVFMVLLLLVWTLTTQINLFTCIIHFKVQSFV